MSNLVSPVPLPYFFCNFSSDLSRSHHRALPLALNHFLNTLCTHPYINPFWMRGWRSSKVFAHTIHVTAEEGSKKGGGGRRSLASLGARLPPALGLEFVAQSGSQGGMSMCQLCNPSLAHGARDTQDTSAGDRPDMSQDRFLRRADHAADPRAPATSHYLLPATSYCSSCGPLCAHCCHLHRFITPFLLHHVLPLAALAVSSLLSLTCNVYSLAHHTHARAYARALPPSLPPSFSLSLSLSVSLSLSHSLSLARSLTRALLALFRCLAFLLALLLSSASSLALSL
jgi:hypothetical protein